MDVQRCGHTCRFMTVRSCCHLVAAAAALACLSCSDAAVTVIPVTVMSFDAATQPEVSASGVITGSGGSAIVTVTVTVRNPDVQPRSATFIRPCTVVLHAFASSARKGSPAFGQESLPGGCKSLAWVDTILAGRTRTFQDQLGVGTILNPPGMPSLVPGRYFFSALIGLRELPLGYVELPAGEGDLTP